MLVTESPWSLFRETPELTAEGARWWRLLETAADASPDDVIAFLRAAHRAIELTNVWEPMFDPLLTVAGLGSRWPELEEPLRSSLAYGLVRVGLLSSEVLPPGLCVRVAAEYIQAEPHALSDAELAWQASLWRANSFRIALEAAALAFGDDVPLPVVRFAKQSAEARASVALMLHAETLDDEADDRGEASQMLASASPAEITALRSMAEEWLAEPERATPRARFRAAIALFDRGAFEPRHDVLLPAEMLDWQGDLASDTCGICGDDLRESRPDEPSLAVVRLLSKLPLERRERFLEMAATSDEKRRPTAELISAWLREPRDASTASFES